MDVSTQITSLRQAAGRARELAAKLASPEERARAAQFADKLEAEANVLENQLVSLTVLP